MTISGVLNSSKKEIAHSVRTVNVVAFQLPYSSVSPVLWKLPDLQSKWKPVAKQIHFETPKAPLPENCHYLTCLEISWKPISQDLSFIWLKSVHGVNSLVRRGFIVRNTYLNNQGSKKSQAKQKIFWGEWKWKYNLLKLTGCSKNSTQNDKWL